MITKFQNYLIKESPDAIFYNGDEFGFEDDDAIPFFINVNFEHTEVERLYIGDCGSTHGDIHYEKERSYPGRLWLDGKIMAFWIYPNPTLFKSIIKSIEDRLDIEIYNNNWKIEVLKFNGKIKSAKISAKTFFYGEDFNKDCETEIIPIEKYSGSQNVPEEIQIQHLMEWNEKELAKKMGKIHFKGFGSDKTAWDSPHNIKYRQTIYQEKKENK